MDSLTFTLTAVFFLAPPIHTVPSDLPTSLTCSVNAKAWRHYSYLDREWGSAIPHKGPALFNTADRTGGDGTSPPRDKVFSRLDTARPIVRSLPVDPRDDEAAEFIGTVVSRGPESAFILWRNQGGNKVWLATVHRRTRKAVVTQLFDGASSVGGELETLDCR